MQCDNFVSELAIILSNIDCPESSAISFSGGLDSSIVAYLARHSVSAYYTVGTANSMDFKNAAAVAEHIGIEFERILIDEHTVEKYIKKLLQIEPNLSAVEASFELPLLIVAEYAKEENICTGQGADELFGGYAKYLGSPELMQRDVEVLLKYTLPRERKIASLFGKRLITPYISEESIELAANMPYSCKISNGTRKWVLREAAMRAGVPDIIISREKKAAQYGSGTWKIIKKLAKRAGLSVDSYIASIVERG